MRRRMWHAITYLRDAQPLVSAWRARCSCVEREGRGPCAKSEGSGLIRAESLGLTHHQHLGMLSLKSAL
eukprot:562075-Rhodomonas_salina.1